MVIILELSHPVVWLVRHVCSDKAEFSVLQRKTALGGIILKLSTNGRYHQRFCLEAWHINSAHAPPNRDDGGLLPDSAALRAPLFCSYHILTSTVIYC